MSNIRKPLWLILIFAGCSCGCQRSRGLDVYPVAGTLVINGVPVGNASVAFHPVADDNLRCPVGLTEAGGSYHLTTLAHQDGAVPGDYVVTVVWPDDTQAFDECECPDITKHDRLKGQYADPAKSPLRAVVRRAPNEFRFEIACENPG